jgi:hypothetical protein
MAIELHFTVPYVSGNTIKLSLTPAGTVPLTGMINKAATEYGSWWTDATGTNFLVVHNFDLLNTDLPFDRSVGASPVGGDGPGIDMMPQMTSLRAQKPNIIIVGYKDVLLASTRMYNWAEINIHEEYFVHDASGSRIRNTKWDAWLMDISNAGYRQHYTSYVNSKINNTAYNGVFADDVWDQMTGYLWVFDKTVPASVVNNHHANMIGFLQYVKANLLSGKILIVNSDEWNTNDYLNVVDGQMIEGFAHPSFAAEYRNQIPVLYNKCTSFPNKILHAISGCDPSTMTQVQLDTLVKYCYASFLCGISGSKAYWNWSQAGAAYAGITNEWRSIMDTVIGTPIGGYSIVANTGSNVYMRDFTGVKALVNQSDNYSYTIDLGKAYRTLTGATVTSVTLAPRNGEVLLVI